MLTYPFTEEESNAAYTEWGGGKIRGRHSVIQPLRYHLLVGDEVNTFDPADGIFDGQAFAIFDHHLLGERFHRGGKTLSYFDL